MLLVAFTPSPAPATARPFDAQPKESVGSGRLLSRAGRCRSASTFFCAARISRLLRSASSTSEDDRLRRRQRGQAKTKSNNELHFHSPTLSSRRWPLRAGQIASAVRSVEDKTSSLFWELTSGEKSRRAAGNAERANQVGPHRQRAKDAMTGWASTTAAATVERATDTASAGAAVPPCAFTKWLSTWNGNRSWRRDDGSRHAPAGGLTPPAAVAGTTGSFRKTAPLQSASPS
jgi:hypothetical protein